MLCYGNGLCCCWNSSSFLEDAVAVLYASGFQFPSVLSTIIWACSLSTAQGTKVGCLSFYLQDIPLKVSLPFFHPRFDANTNLLHPSKALFLTPPSRLTTFILHLFSAFGLTELTLHPKTGNILEANNLTILNFFLLRLGPMNEERLVKVLMGSQVSVFPLFYIYHAQAC
jgi:hypothetical protein